MGLGVGLQGPRGSRGRPTGSVGGGVAHRVPGGCGVAYRVSGVPVVPAILGSPDGPGGSGGRGVGGLFG